MDITVLLEGIGFGFLLSFMFGPAFFLLLENSISKGFRAGMTFDLGVLLSDVLVVVVVYFASASIADVIKDHNLALSIGAGALVIVFGIFIVNQDYKKYRRDKLDYSNKSGSKKGGQFILLFTKGFFLNILNPGIIFFWTTVILSYTTRYESDIEKVRLFLYISFTTFALVDLIKILSAKRLKRILSDKVQFKVKRFVGFIFIVLGGVMILKPFVENFFS